MPLGFLFKLLELRVGYYGPKLAALLFGEPTRWVLFLQHLVIGWVSALPLLLILLYLPGLLAPIGLTSRRFLACRTHPRTLALT